MKAIVHTAYGSADEVLKVRDIPTPVLKAGQVLVRAASMHPDVWHVIEGVPYVARLMGNGATKPKILVPGTDLAGVVESVGANVTEFKAGDEVFGESAKFAWQNGGAFAEYAAVPAKFLGLKPANVTFEQAAVVPTSGYIALTNVHAIGALKGRNVLINGGGGCMGPLAIQFAKAEGARVTGVDSAEKLELMRSVGADRVIDYAHADFLQGSERYDLIVDIASTLWFDVCQPVLTPTGAYQPIGHAQFGKATGRMGGRIVGSMPVFVGLLLKALLDPEKRKNFKMLSKLDAMATFRALLESGQLTPVIGRTFPLGEVAAAMRCMQECQSQAKPAFDAADVQVRPHGSNPNPQVSGGVLRGGRYDLRNATMVDLISLAYDVDGTVVLGGPNWLETDRFDVVAKAPQTTSTDNIKIMLQGLLADRFKLALHKDTKQQQGFVLAAGSGKARMKQGSGDTAAPGDCVPVPPPPPDPAVTPQNMAACHNMPMSMFVQMLRGMAGAYVNGPITDLTGLTGGWDFDLKWTNRALLAQAGSDGISMFDAVDKQLGLKLESRSIPTPVVIVDSVNQKPTDNPSNIAQVLPPAPPAEFEVASVKLSDPTITQPMGRIQPGGRVDVQGFTLRMLATMAWDLNDDELLVGPKWIDEARYSITARTSTASLGAAGANTPPLDFDDVRLMMRALLVDRFKMKTHVEERPVTAYTLLAAGPKLTKADPTNRTGWKNGAAPGARDPRDNNPILARLVTGRNMSMAQLAEALPAIAPGYIRTPVVDETGITGNWDFTFTFTPNGVGGIGAGRGGDGGQGPGAGAPPSAAADPSGAISLFDALNKQLGLRLQVQKRPLPVVVIDSAEQKPSDD